VPIFPLVTDSVSALLPAFVSGAIWWVAPALLAWRSRATPSLTDASADPPAAALAPRVSVILPARNEAAHITACVRAIRQSTWPNLELIVVDDHSTDGTGALAREAALGDARVRVVPAPDLPAGWFGKQWACQVGAEQASGSLLLFTDADTRHAADLVTRLVAVRAQRDAELMSVAGRQDMVTVWEQAVQPSVFALILLRYGGATALEGARRASDVIANGQCFMISRAGYDAVGRHEAVRAFVAEDLMMAQAVWRAGRRVSLVMGVDQLSTRMYDGLGPLMRGWGKNIYAGGRFAVRGGALGRLLYPLLLPLFPLALLAPFVTLLAALAQLASGHAAGSLLAWSVLASSGVLCTFVLANRLNRDPIGRALLAPLGALVLLVICLQAIGRGRRVAWKDRDYVTA
jgi:chlorobactene glucosyltransferase